MAAASPVMEFQVELKKLMRILVIEDEQDAGKSLKEVLESWGYDVDLAESTSKAEYLLGQREYELVVTDVVFENGTVQGDEFIVANEGLIKRAKRVVITGWGFDRVHRMETLDAMGVKVLKKGDQNFLEDLQSLANDKLEERKRELVQSIRQVLPEGKEVRAEVRYSVAAQGLVEKAQRILLDWLNAKVDVDKSGIFYSGRTYSPRMLIKEIESGTEVGKAHLDMFLDLIKHNLGV